MDQTNPSNRTWYIVGAVVVIAVLALWYYSTQSPGIETPSDTTADLSDELEQIPEDSAALDADAAASAAALQGF